MCLKKYYIIQNGMFCKIMQKHINEFLKFSKIENYPTIMFKFFNKIVESQNISKSNYLKVFLLYLILNSQKSPKFI